MGCIQKSSLCPNIHIFFLSFIILVILSTSHARFMTQGGWNSKLNDNDTRVIENTYEHDGNLGMSDVKAGSRPPTCASARKKYCRKCGKCEAIQVPILGPRTRTRTRSRSTSTRRDDISNYKPLCWKCKCGDFIFNP